MVLDTPQGDSAGAPVALSRQALYAMLWSRPLSSIAREIGISANGLAKICDRMLVPYPGRGYWAKVQSGHLQPQPPPLPAVSAGSPDIIAIGDTRAGSRRPRTRLAPAERRRQIAETAAKILADEGPHAVSIKRVARDVGISEAQMYNHFCSLNELFVFMAREEYAAMNLARQHEFQSTSDYRSRYVLASLAYLRYFSKRGRLLQRLLEIPEVAAALAPEQEARKRANSRMLVQDFGAKYGLDEVTSLGVGRMLSAMTVRGGKLIAQGRIDLETAERMVVALTVAGLDNIIERHGTRRSAG